MHRLIALEGATNFRDLGGYEALDGRRVRWRRLFRADGLHRLTPGDGGVLAALGLEEALDMRYGPERAGEPALLPDSVASVHIGLAAAPGASLLETMNLGGVSSAAVAKDWLTRSYAGYPEKYAPACGAILRRLVAEDAPPLLFHCTAGKDRTGFAAAVVLEALGVPRDHDHGGLSAHQPPLGPRQPRTRRPAARNLRAGVLGAGGIPRRLRGPRWTGTMAGWKAGWTARSASAPKSGCGSGRRCWSRSVFGIGKG